MIERILSKCRELEPKHIRHLQVSINHYFHSIFRGILKGHSQLIDIPVEISRASRGGANPTEAKAKASSSSPDPD